jgi:hypothetical protein
MKLFPTFAFVVVLCGHTTIAGAQSVDRLSTFLDRPYSIRDRAVDQLKDDASEWALQISMRDFSNDLEELDYGLQASANTYVRVGTSDIVVEFSFGVKRIIGDRRKTCATAVRLAYSQLMPPGVDVRGNDMRAKYMMFRMGTAVRRDTAAAREASRMLVQLTTVQLHITELATDGWVSCAFGAEGFGSFKDSKEVR